MSNQNDSVNKPQFFIVGAPRCGTTALSDFLSQHPSIYFSYVKEPHYFGSDLPIRRGFRSEDEYLQLFREAQERIAGEGSTWYLFSKRAAQEIHEFNPDAKIIVMLRNPADMLYSWHGHILLTGEETIDDFEEALKAEPDRRQGKRIPKNTPINKLLYSDIPRYTEQIQRFHSVFGAQNVHTIIYDDFQANQAQVVRDTFKFLGVDPDFIPEITVVNGHGEIKSKSLQYLTHSQPQFVRNIVKTLLPSKVRSQLRHSMHQMNTKPSERAALAPELREHLNKEFAQEISRLSHFLKRDLGHWVDTHVQLSR
jgi:hypothetical protein